MTATTAIVPVFPGSIADHAIQLCCARTLHTFLNVRRDFTTWIKGRIQKFGFIAGEDFITVENLSSPDLVNAKSRAQKLTDYHLTLDMAKELSMVENNEQGRAARRYFIECERRALAAQQSQSIPYTVQPGDKLNAKQQATLRELLETNAKRLPPEKQGPAIMRGWSKLKAHFKVGYRDIPADQFTDAVSLLSRHVAELEVVEPVFPSINAAQLLLEGQSEHPLPNDVHTLIDRRAAEITVDAHMLIREHLQRRVSFRVNHYPDTSREQVADVLKEAELGNCLTHAYHSEVRRVLSMLGSAAQMAASSVQRLQAEMNALRPEPPTLMV